MNLSVVIVNYNVRYFLELCLQSVYEAIADIDAEIIVVDNNSADDSCKMITTNFPDVILVKNKKNTGFSKANNQGVEIAKGEYILILNPDTVVSNGTFTKILKFADSKENFGALGVQLIDGKGGFLPESKRGIPNFKASFYKIFGFNNSKNLTYYANHLLKDETGEIEILVGAFMLIKRSVYNKVNGFDQDYFMYGEDIDLSYKILKKGYQNYYYSKVSVIHFKGESTIKDLVYLKRFYTAMQIFYKKHFKVNFMYDFLINISIGALHFLKKFKIQSEPAKLFYKAHAVLYLGKDNTVFENLKLLDKTKVFYVFDDFKNIELLQLFIESKKIEEIVFDNNVLSYASIIEAITLLSSLNLTFKIHPKKTNFILGSNSSESRGEVIIFNK